jgi:hypothetical protein
MVNQLNGNISVFKHLLQLEDPTKSGKLQRIDDDDSGDDGGDSGDGDGDIIILRMRYILINSLMHCRCSD